MVGSNSLQLLCVTFLCVFNTHSASKLLQTTARKMLKLETTLAEKLKKNYILYFRICISFCWNFQFEYTLTINEQSHKEFVKHMTT